MAWSWGNAIKYGGVGGFIKDKKKSSGPQASEFKPYTGLRPPRVNYDPTKESPNFAPGNIFRPVQQLITDTVARRSQGQDVGYDPARRDALQENFDIQQNRDFENQTADIKNRLAGQGLSHNVAANDELLGRALRAKNEEKALYTNRINIEDLARRNDERDANTARLQALNAQNFGQENDAANFDLNVYNAENNAELGFGGLDLRRNQQAYDQREDPLGTALQLAGQGAGLYADYQTGGAYSALAGALKSGQSPTYDSSTIRNPSGTNYSDATNLKNDPTYLALTNKGYNLRMG